MGNRAVRAHASNKDGDQVTVQSHETDAPILPVEQLNTLHQFRPDLVDFVIAQTELEAAHRRQQDARVNAYIFFERILGQVAAIVVAALGIGGGIYAGLNGEPVLGGVIASSTIGTLAVAFLHRQGKQDAKKK